MANLLKIVTWNLGYGSLGSVSLNNKETVRKALAYCHGKGAHVVLAQEMYIPSGVADGEITAFDSIYKYCIFNTIPKDRPEDVKWKGRAGMDAKNANDSRKWGTAILSTLPLENADNVIINEAYPGTITAAKINDLNLISMYGKRGMDKISTDGKKVGEYSYQEMLNFCIKDLKNALSAKRVVIAGDWNIGHLKNEVMSKESEAVIQRIAAFGLNDNLGLTEYHKTYHGCGTGRESQVDWVFVSKALADCSKSCIDATPGVEAYSDHYPLITDLRI